MDTDTASSYRGYRFPVEIISHCVWLYFRFCLSFRDVQEMLLERGVVVSLANSYIRLLLASEIVRGNVAANRTDPAKRAAVPACLISPGECPHGVTDDNGYYCSKP